MYQLLSLLFSEFEGVRPLDTSTPDLLTELAGWMP